MAGLNLGFDGTGDTTLYTSNNLLYEVIIRMVLIPAVLLFIAYRFIIRHALREDENDGKTRDIGGNNH